MSGGDTNYPIQPTYGEGLEEALRAQTEMLMGTGEFQDLASEIGMGPGETFMQKLMEQYEAPLRETTAQVDTDVMRRTLLGEQQVADEQGRIITGYETNEAAVAGFEEELNALRDTKKALQAEETSLRAAMDVGAGYADAFGGGIRRLKPEVTAGHTDLMDRIKGVDEEIRNKTAEIKAETTPIYSEVGAYDPGEVIREGTGMLDLFGPREAGAATQEITTDAQRYDAYVRENPDLRNNYAAAKAAGDERSMSDWGREHYDVFGKAEIEAGSRDALPGVGETYEVTRRAGFDPQTGEFLGLTTLGADVSRQLARAQRAGDIADVELLGQRATEAYREQGVEYDPTTGEAIAGTGIRGALATARGLAPGGEDPLRTGLRRQAEEGLEEGLTERERRNIQEASRARHTAMGRTFDPTATIDELRQQVLEDRNREALNRAFAQNVLGQEEASARGMVGLEQATGADPFQAILGRPSGAGAQMGQQMFGQAGYGLQSAPQYLNPEAGLGYLSQQAANEASMWGAGQAADAARAAGMWGGLGALGGGLGGGLIVRGCWVAREVYGAHNPAWLDFREWMLFRSPRWFRSIYLTLGERFARFISDKPRLKARIRGWMDTKIGRA